MSTFHQIYNVKIFSSILYVTSPFSLAAFKILSSSLIAMCLCLYPFEFIFLRVHWTFCSVGSCISLNLGRYWSLFLQIFLLPFLSSPFRSTILLCWYSSWCDTGSKGSVQFSSSFFLSTPQAGEFQLLHLWVHWFFLSGCWNLLLNYSGEFSISIIVFFNPEFLFGSILQFLLFLFDIPYFLCIFSWLISVLCPWLPSVLWTYL